MKSLRLASLIVLLVISPLITAAITGILVPFTPADDATKGVWGLGPGILIILGIPLIAVVGSLESYRSRKSTNSTVLTKKGYLVSALVINGMILFSFLALFF